MWVRSKGNIKFKNKNAVEFRSVEFRTVEEAKRAVEKMHQFEYGGRKLAVKLVRRINSPNILAFIKPRCLS